MNTRTLMTVTNRLNAAKPVEFDGIRNTKDQMRTLLAEPNVKRLKP